MNYYIQGDAAKADQIKAAFEAKGCVMHTGIQCDLSDMIYFSLNGKVGGIKLRNLELFKTHPDYKELELAVKPEFKVGDWVVRKDGETFFGDNYAEQITLIVDDEEDKCIWLSSKTWIREDDIRLWTIADAKDGDVLVDEDTNTIGIFEKIYGIRWHSKIYCAKSTYTMVYDYGGSHKIKFTKPATKEQRDLLFQKIKEAGYEWDADKKELLKIKHYAIANFHAGMPVLVRDGDSDDDWTYALFSHYNSTRTAYKFSASGEVFRQCIPFNDDTKHLLGTTDMCDEQYINW